MQNFMTSAGKVYSFEDDVIAAEISGIWTFKTAAGAVLAVPSDLSPCPNNVPASAAAGQAAVATWSAYQVEARAALAATDMVALRCLKAAQSFPAEWQSYTQALRSIVGAATGDPTQPLPARPPYPAGT